MRRYPEDAWERAMKAQDVILRAMAKQMTWGQAAEVQGISVRSMRRWRERWERYGYGGLFDRRRLRPMFSFPNVASVDRIIFSIFNRFDENWRNRTLQVFTQAA